MKMNTPNKITIARILMLPIILFFYLTSFFPATKLVALILFIIASATDFLDGYIARKYNMVTSLGKFLDPIADKLLATCGVLLIVCNDVFAAPYGMLLAFIMLSRDFIVGLLRQIAATKGTVIAADNLGKFKTVVLDLFVPIFMLISSNNTLNFMNSTLVAILSNVGYALAAIFVILSIISMIHYIKRNKEVLA